MLGDNFTPVSESSGGGASIAPVAIAGFGLVALLWVAGVVATVYVVYKVTR